MRLFASHTLQHVAVVIAVSGAVGCQPPPADPTPQPLASAGASGLRTFKVEVWADNWFACYLGDTPIAEDSVSIDTERSFNSETFTFQADYPFQLNFIAKDFKENDSGLEYIGSNRQQMGDGGFIAQITDVATGEVVAATDSRWKAMVTHHGPVDAACADERNPVAGAGPCAFVVTEPPLDWMAPAFDDTAWSTAAEFSEGAVRPKDGYDRIDWDPNAKLIWTTDLKKDNTILIRRTVAAP